MYVQLIYLHIWLLHTIHNLEEFADSLTKCTLNLIMGWVAANLL